MNMKEVQLLGILAVVAGGIIVLSLWGSQPNTRETGKDGGGVNEGPESVEKADTSPSEEGDMEDWEWLAREARAEERDSKETRETKDDDDDELLDEELENEVSTELEGFDPVDIGLEEAESSESDGREAPRMHTVKKGETLSMISKKYYDTSAKWKQIFEANEDVVKSPEALVPEMEIVIPPASESESAAREEEDKKPMLSGENESSREYRVKKGETLWSLADKFYGNGNKYHKITKANEDVDDPKDVREGITIVIPE